MVPKQDPDTEQGHIPQIPKSPHLSFDLAVQCTSDFSCFSFKEFFLFLNGEGPKSV